jgi:hypothetical protein
MTVHQFHRRNKKHKAHSANRADKLGTRLVLCGTSCVESAETLRTQKQLSRRMALKTVPVMPILQLKQKCYML